MKIVQLERSNGFFIKCCSPVISIEVHKELENLPLASKSSDEFIHDDIIHILSEVARQVEPKVLIIVTLARIYR